MMPRSSASSWPAYIVIFMLALGLRLGYDSLVWSGALGNGDSAAYEDLGAKILHGQAYQTNQNAGPACFPPDLQRPPGYPIFLAALRLPFEATSASSRVQISIVQCFIGALFTVLLSWLVAKIVNPPVGLIAGCFYAIDWVTIVHTPMVIADTIYSVMLGTAILLYALVLSKHQGFLSLVAGLVLGCAALVKPAAQLIVLAFLIGWACRKDKRWVGLLFLVTYLACVLPWMVRNDRRHGVLTLSEIGTVDLYFFIAEGALHSYPIGDLAGKQITTDVDQLDIEWRNRALSPSELSRQMRHDSVLLIVNHWPTVLRQSTIGLARTSLGTGSITATDSMNARPGRTARVLLNVLPLAQICLLWTMAIYGALVSRVLSGELRVLLIASVFCILLPAAAPLGQSRYRVPAIPALCVLAAAGLATLRDRYAFRPGLIQT